MFVKTAVFLYCAWTLVNADDDSSSSLLPTNLSPLCLVCKCTPSKAVKSQFNVLCNDISSTYELSRDDAWPSQVRSVSLTHASLTNVPKLPQRSLHSLSLSHNALISIPDKAFESLNLKELNLGYNGLTELTMEALSGNNELKNLHLQHNNFNKLDWNIFNHLKLLQELYLQDNYLKQLDGKTNLQYLQVLNLSGNALEVLPPDTCGGLPALTELHLADNQLSEVPECLLQLHALQLLVLDGNAISKVQDGAFYSLAALSSLSLSNLPQLTEVNGAALRGLGSLHTLRCSHNPRLTSVHRTLLIGEDAAQHDWKLIDVDLSYNGLTSIPSDLAAWSMLGSLNLQGNPWDCGCPAQWMLDSLVPVLYKKNSSLLEDARCATPGRLAGKRLVHWLGRDPAIKVFCDDSDPAPMTQVSLLQSGSSHGMLIALSAVAGVALVLMVLGVVLQRRATQQRKQLATKTGRCRNPRNGSVRLTNPKFEI